MSKRCIICKQAKDIGSFHLDNSRQDRLESRCKNCRNAGARRLRKTPAGRAATAWYNIESRCSNSDGENPSYLNVKNKMSRQWFLSWYVDKYIPGCSVDRIIPSGDYEQGNVQLIPMRVNSMKRGWDNRGKSPAGHKWCYMCRSHKETSLFFMNKSKPDGFGSPCKSCSRKRIR